jgi:hypothetical protein
MSNEVVVRYLDGTLLKGTSLDVDPGRPTCHVRPPTGAVVEVALNKVKALFFVRSLEGDPKHTDVHDINPSDPRLRGSTAMTITFKDGEQLTGLTNHFPPTRPFFFVMPIDTGANNLRVLVNKAAVAKMDAALRKP